MARWLKSLGHFLAHCFRCKCCLTCIYIYFTHQLQLQIDANSRYQERVRKAIAARPRNAVVGGADLAHNPAVAAAAAAALAGHDDAAADASELARHADDSPAPGDRAVGGAGPPHVDDAPAHAPAVGGAGPPHVAASRAPPNVAPPERWCDTHINWRHPLTFVFVLNGPLTYFHPSAGHRLVCGFLKKAPRSGPQEVVRAVSRDDNRRSQRAVDRSEERSGVAEQNGELLQALHESRCTLAVALYLAH